MSTSNLQWKVYQRVKVLTSKTPIPQWITGKVIHETTKKVCIKFDEHWVGIEKHEWVHKNSDNKIVIKHLNQQLVKYCTLPMYKNEIHDSWKKGESNKVTIPDPINELHTIYSTMFTYNIFDWNPDFTHKKWNEKTEKFETISILYENPKLDIKNKYIENNQFIDM
eukprot:236729_1